MNRITSGMVALLAAVMAVTACAPSRPKTQPITLATIPFESLTPVYVAEDRDMFAKSGLRVTYREYPTGAGALEGLLKGEADVAIGTSEFPLVRKALQGTPVRAIATFDRPEFIYVIGRKDRGVAEAADLRGKRVGTVAGTIPQFYLGRLLELNGMTAEDITFVDLKTPSEWNAALEKGDVDAVVLAQPDAGAIRDRLGTNASFFSAQGNQAQYSLAISGNDWIAKNPGAVRSFLTAMAEAEEFIASNPAGARKIVQKRLKLDPDYMDLVEKQNNFALSLDQSLILAMEDEARWLIKNKLTTATVVPDFNDYVDATGLRAVRPEAVNVVR